MTDPTPEQVEEVLRFADSNNFLIDDPEHPLGSLNLWKVLAWALRRERAKHEQTRKQYTECEVELDIQDQKIKRLEAACAEKDEALRSIYFYEQPGTTKLLCVQLRGTRVVDFWTYDEGISGEALRTFKEKIIKALSSDGSAIMRQLEKADNLFEKSKVIREKTFPKEHWNYNNDQGLFDAAINEYEQSRKEG